MTPLERPPTSPLHSGLSQMPISIEVRLIKGVTLLLQLEALVMSAICWDTAVITLSW